MMLLVAMAISVAYAASLATTIGWFDLEFWWELSALVTIMLLGHWLEMKALGQAQSPSRPSPSSCPTKPNASTTTATSPSSASTRSSSATSCSCAPAGVSPPMARSSRERPRSTSRWSPGSPVRWPKGADDRVVAGTVATDSSVRVRVKAVGDDTALAGIQRLVAEAQSSQSRAQALADRFAALLFYVAAGAALAHLHRLDARRRHGRRRSCAP